MIINTSMIDMPKVAAVVVLYNPDASVIENINTYADQVEKLYVVDNSETADKEFWENEILRNKNTEYYCNNSNIGIAGALNIGARKAISDGYEYLLTMDQDGKAAAGMVVKLAELMDASSKTGIAVPEHVDADLHEIPAEEINKEILYTMTNGNMLRLSAFQKIGGFLEELFIDHIDHEYCLRMNKNGYKVIKTNKTFVYHKLGKAAKKKIFGINLYPTYHPPVRLYYRTRNRFYVDSIYKTVFPGYVREDRKHMLRELLDIILCEKDLRNKIKMVFTGYIHYKKKLFGKFEDAKGKKF